MENSRLQKIFTVLIILFCGALVVSMVRTLWLSRQSYEALQNQKEKVENQENRAQELETEVRTATSSFTLEKRVRDEFGLQKPDETTFSVEVE